MGPIQTMFCFFFTEHKNAFFGQNIALHCVECSSVVVCMKSNPSIKRVVCSHIFSIQFGKVQQKPCIEKSTLGSSELLQTSASQAR